MIVLKRGTTLIFKSPINGTSGSVETNHFYDSPDVYSFKKQYLGYNVEYIQNVTGAVLATSSMETNPTWMTDEATLLGDLRIDNIFIPGTHDSGAYTGVLADSEKRIEKYVIAQDEPVLNQLIFGIRSLDLRVSYYSVRNHDYDQLYINHGVRGVRPLREVVEQIKEFLEKTREILILDFHQFPIGFSNFRILHLKPHETLIDYLLQELGPFIAPPQLTWNARLQDFWNLNKTLILAYNNRKMLSKYSHILWPPVHQKWGNAQELSKLKEYMRNVFANPPIGPWSAQAELTATGRKIITDKLRGLRQMAASINTQVTEWFQSDWGAKCHIVTCDFFRSTGIVKTAISWNLRRATGDSCDL
uniref:PI-PLC X domain-containing protein 1 n=1 Tax=Cacopsylla melanoneura TaxID=428564 RepID=A0A8D8M707_9HEMI